MAATELLDAPPTAIAKPQPIDFSLLREQALSSFSLQSETIAMEVAADTLLMVGNDGERAAANKRRMVWVRRRTDLERTRKAAQADAKKIVELVKEVAETFQADFSKAEDHLAAQIDLFDAKIAAAEKEKADKFFNDRNAQLLHVGITLARPVVESLADADIAKMIDDKVEADRLRKEEAERIALAKAEADRIAAEQAEAYRRDAEKLAAERAAFAKQQAEQAEATAKLMREHEEKLAAERLQRKKEQAAQQAELDAQRKVLEEAQRKIEEAAFAVAEREREQREAEQQAERDRISAIEKEKADTFEAERLRILKEKSDADAASAAAVWAEMDKISKEKAEALRPDREKLLAFADSLQLLVLPKTSALIEIEILIADQIRICADAIRRIVAERMS